MAEFGFNVDCNGKRIKTDILVSGYFRNSGKRYKVLIPEDIKGICFMYWLLNPCDKWDRKFSSKRIKIEEEIGRCKKAGTASIYGSLSIDRGSYSWRIRYKTKIQWICIGVIRDNPEILKQFQRSNRYIDSYHGCYLSQAGYFYDAYTRLYNYGDNKGRKYCKEYRDKDTIITMTLNMDEQTLRYKINDREYGIATDQLEKDKYRMVVNMCWLNDTIELL